MKLTQASKFNKEWTPKATPTRKLQQTVGVKIPFQVFCQTSPWSPNQYVPFGSPFVRIKKVGY